MTLSGLTLIPIIASVSGCVTIVRIPIQECGVISHLDLSKKFRNNLILYCSGEKVSYYHQFKKAEDMEAIIYDITGKIVYNFGKIHGNQDDVKLLEWDGKDSQGRCCAPGYYILYVKPDKVRYKIVIW